MTGDSALSPREMKVREGVEAEIRRGWQLGVRMGRAGGSFTEENTQVELLSDQKVPALDIALSICKYTHAKVKLQIQDILGYRMRLGAVSLPRKQAQPPGFQSIWLTEAYFSQRAEPQLSELKPAMIIPCSRDNFRVGT